MTLEFSTASAVWIEAPGALVVLAGTHKLALGVTRPLLGFRVLALGSRALLGRGGLLLLRVRLARGSSVTKLTRLTTALLLTSRSRGDGHHDQGQDHGPGNDGDDGDGAHVSLLLRVKRRSVPYPVTPATG
jgi:hypothetical protein